MYTQALLQPWADSARRLGLVDIAFTDHDRYHAGIDFDEIERDLGRIILFRCPARSGGEFGRRS